jgi:Cu2+-exporting ATPase
VGGPGGQSPLGLCPHCNEPSPGSAFCCPGCAAAYKTINTLGLGGYYARRLLAASGRPLQPEPTHHINPARHIVTEPDGSNTLELAVDGLSCGACVWLIESILAREPDLRTARVNMTTRRLRLRWRGDPARAAHFCAVVQSLGYRLAPFNPAAIAAASDATGRALLRALAVAAFAAANVMLLSLATWFGLTQHMGPATRDLLHWVSALIAMPAVAYAGQPFFRSAAAALRHGRTNMDVPISIGVTLVMALSLWQTMAGGPHTYFDSATALLFFLLIGRVLDHRARQHARFTAEQLLLLRATDAAVLQPDGTIQRIQADQIAANDTLLIGMGERIAADGTLLSPTAQIDTSLVTGESLPQTITQGAKLFAGTVNVGAAITVRATETGGGTLLAECARLIEAAAQSKNRFVILADRAARRYAPTVHLCAITTFLVWWQLLHRPLADSLITAASVLIITCPCALALAVPAVQVIATSRLFRHGILLKSPTALERLALIDTIVFDKTGTLTDPVLGLAAGTDPESLRSAAALAATSRHPLCRALTRAAGPIAPAPNVEETPGQGLLAAATGARLGSRAFCGLPAAPHPTPELMLARPGHAPTIFRFHQTPRPDAAATIATLHRAHYALEIASGDTAPSVQAIADLLAIQTHRAALSPLEKVRHIEALRAAGRHVLMVGDGLNDGPCLAAATVSAAPASAADISQTVADVVYQGASLAPVAEILATARRAGTVMRQNLGLALAYNAIMVPLAMCGFITPWLAAAAMSSSSLLVLANAFRAAR